jgi:hypothetical protein
VPVYIKISRLDRCVTIVARGDLKAEDIESVIRQLTDGGVLHLAKLVDAIDSTPRLTHGETRQIAQSFRKILSDEECGPVAFLIDPFRSGFAAYYAQSQNKRRVQLFTNLHQARDWLIHTLRAGWRNAPALRDGVPSRGRRTAAPLSVR